MKKLLLVGFLIFVSFPANTLNAADSYIRKGSIGKERESKSETIKGESFPFRPISSWIGEQFIFLPRPKSSQKYGYQDFKGGDGEYGQPSYDKYVGRISTVFSVSKQDDLWDVKFKMVDNGHRLAATAYFESVRGIVPIFDIDRARSMWLGKTLWYSKQTLLTYNEDTEKYGYLTIKKWSPVKVVEIVVAWDESTPARFILQTNSRAEGFMDINLSGTNVSESFRNRNRFEDFFFTQDPRTTFKWPNKIWSAIEEGKVLIGMTPEQAQMSWGKPKEINRTIGGTSTHEQWVYGSGGYLYFENGILKSVQN